MTTVSTVALGAALTLLGSVAAPAGDVTPPGRWSGWGASTTGSRVLESPRGPVGPYGADDPLPVPFLAQGPLLCGGASAAMIERFWGARSVYAEDYAHLVREDEGGIRTSELAGALEARGLRVRASTGEPALLDEMLDAGVPSIVLLEGGMPTLHYVVVTGADDTAVTFHDPNYGPDRRLGRDAFMARWGASRYWALVAEPGDDPAGSHTVARNAGVGAGDHVDGSSAPGPPPPAAVSPRIDSALALVRARRYGDAERAARPLLDARAGDRRVALRVVATSRYLGGDELGALAPWNALGEPRIDLVRVLGAANTRHHAFARRMGLAPRTLLRADVLEVARRRLALLPAVARSRIGYRPVASGAVEVEAAVVERPRWPARVDVARAAVSSLAHERIRLSVGPFLGAGDRWTAGGGWNAARSFAIASLEAPAPPLPGIVTVAVSWDRERFPIDVGTGDPVEPGRTAVVERTSGSIGLEEWVTPAVKLGSTVALERWTSRGRFVRGRLSGRIASPDDALGVTAAMEGWAGSSGRFGRFELVGTAVRDHGTRRATRLLVGATIASGSAPRSVWPGAGIGQVRSAPLRGHPLVDDGAISGPAFAPTLLNATAEHHLFTRLGPFRAGLFVFVDAAHVRGRPDGTEAGSYVDAGVGGVVGSGVEEVSLNLARGESGWVVSARVATAPWGGSG